MLTKYEVAEIVSTRAALLEKGSEPLVPHADEATCVKIATDELRAGVLAALVERHLPNGTVIVVDVQDALLPDNVF